MRKWFKNLAKNQKGFSMIETVLTSMILAVGLVGGLLVFQNASANTLYSDFTTIATQSANEKLEEVMADKEFSGYAIVTEANYPSENLSTPYEMTRTVSVLEVSASDLVTPDSGSGLKKVDVSVCWGDCSSSHTATVSTLIADY